MPDLPATSAPTAIRLTSDEREATVARLSAAFADDAITLEEFEHRVAAVYRAASAVELSTLVADLPAVTAPSVSLVPMSTQVRALFASVERSGSLDVPHRLDVRATFGNVEMDLRAARFAPGLTEISVRALFGNVEIVLPSYVRVENHGGGMLASFTCRVPASSALPPEAPTVRITGRALLGNVEISSDT